MEARGQCAFRPAGDYCRLCLLHGSVLPRGQGHVGAPYPAPEPGLGLLPWRGHSPFPFPLELGMAEERRGNRDRRIPQRRQVYVGPSHCSVSESGSPPWYTWREVSTSSWDWPLGPRLSPCTCVWERPRECECARPWHPPEQPRPCNGGPVAYLLPPKVRGQRYYREACYVATEHYWDFCGGTHLQGPERDNLDARGYNGHCERRHVTFETRNDGSECESEDTSRPDSPSRPHCVGPRAFFATEVPQSQFRSCRTPASRSPAGASQGGDPKPGHAGRAEEPESRRNQRKSQGSVREQIKQVVAELEDVLGGLKQVQLEMKEVVQQIDILTSNIDLGEGEPQDQGRHGNCFGVVTLIHDSEGESECLLQGGVRRGSRSRATSDLSECGPATSISSRRNLASPRSPAHDPDGVEPSWLNHMLAADMHCAKGTANGDGLPTRPPRAKVKEVRRQRSGTDHVGLSKTPEPLVLLAGSAKAQRPLLYSQNGQVKMPPQESNCPPDILKMPDYPRKNKQFPSTVV